MEQPLELILARNLASIVSLAAFLVDVEGRIVLYNDAAAELVGSPFEEIGTMTREEWNAAIARSTSRGSRCHGLLLGRPPGRRRHTLMRAKPWDVRGSVPVPGRATERFGGNTSCVQVTAEDGSEFVLDAGTGIRALGAAMAGRCRRPHVLLSHLHLDHIQGPMFFAPLFDPEVTFRDIPSQPWHIGAMELRAALVSHRGPTLGYRLSENGTSLC